ncbi:MAG: fumarate reductase subunit D [Defluviicoccus sp.]|nr:MAG: fumarate reductase subunit D [Defluviicoccus sp.]
MARSAKAVPWFLFAAGGTITAFVLPVMLFVTNIGPALGLFHDAMSYETLSSFLSWWIVKLALLGIIVLGLWHSAHRLRSCAHDFGIRADAGVAVVLYGLATIGTLATIVVLLSI